MTYLVVPMLSLALTVGCESPRTAAPSATVVTSTAVPQATAAVVQVSTATPVPSSTTIASPHSTSTAVPISTSTAGAVSPASTPKPAIPIGTSVVSQGADWKLYLDQSRGFEFRYPPACTVEQHNESFTVGGRIELVVADAKGLALQDYVTQFIDERVRASGWKPESRQTVLAGSSNAVRIDYRFGGANRFGTAIFVEQKGQVYIWGLTAGGFTCDEGSAFDGIVSSFKSIS